MVEICLPQHQFKQRFPETSDIQVDPLTINQTTKIMIPCVTVMTVVIVVTVVTVVGLSVVMQAVAQR